MDEFVQVTEIAGEEATREQLQRMVNRYRWAGSHSTSKDVLEIACGSGVALSYLSSVACSVRAGDINETLVSIANKLSPESVKVSKLDALNLPFSNDSFDVIIMFEAIYYLDSFSKFLDECHRVLRKDGVLLLTTANKDLFDFNPSPYSKNYYGVVELEQHLTAKGFSTEFFADSPLKEVSFKQKLLRPIKKIAVSLHCVPKTMRGKRFLKKLVFGRLQPIPSSIDDIHLDPVLPEKISHLESNKTHKIIFCRAQKNEGSPKVGAISTGESV